ncbi:hypothetical protein Elgi_23310 [Paenibacillus elgii]|nr:hypothetical protein Elgi_23310 [Paenibacillus elgii]
MGSIHIREAAFPEKGGAAFWRFIADLEHAGKACFAYAVIKQIKNFKNSIEQFELLLYNNLIKQKHCTIIITNGGSSHELSDMSRSWRN